MSLGNHDTVENVTIDGSRYVALVDRTKHVAVGGTEDMDLDGDHSFGGSAGMDRAMAAATVGAGCSMVAAQLLSGSPSLHPDHWGSGANNRGLSGDSSRCVPPALLILLISSCPLVSSSQAFGPTLIPRIAPAWLN